MTSEAAVADESGRDLRHASTPDHGDRHRRIAPVFERADLDALVLGAGSDLVWLCGFTGSTGIAVVDRDEVVLIVDGRYLDQARAELDAAQGPFRVVGISTSTERDVMLTRFTATRSRVGFDPQHCTVSEHERVLAALGRPLVAVAAPFAALRRRKDAIELARIERACQIADEALASVTGMIGASEPVTEVDLRDELEYRMRRLGAEGPSYPTIVASGPQHAACAHHQPVPRRLVEGDTVVIDVGALVEGYHSDMTRSFVVGDPRPRQRELYELVAAAQRAGLAAVVPGEPVANLDAACREVISEAGLGDWFVHGASHGVGLDIHEIPFSTPSTAASADLFAPGDVVTVEPGVYRDGFGGIRIEDLVVLTETGHRVLTGSPKDDPCPPSPPTT